MAQNATFEVFQDNANEWRWRLRGGYRWRYIFDRDPSRIAYA